MFGKTVAGLILVASLCVPAVGRPLETARQQKRAERQQLRLERKTLRALQQRKGREQVRKSALNLSPAQAEQLKSQRQDNRAERTRIRQIPDKNQRRSELQSMRQKFQSDLRGILTPEQQQLLGRRARQPRK